MISPRARWVAWLLGRTGAVGDRDAVTAALRHGHRPLQS